MCYNKVAVISNFLNQGVIFCASFLSSIGPVIRGEPGDVIVVTFRNMASNNYSLQPHGLSYDKLYEGAMYQDGKTYTTLSLFVFFAS